jgi:DNA-binding winged helix-turn-helix (wHTH) protein
VSDREKMLSVIDLSKSQPGVPRPLFQAKEPPPAHGSHMRNEGSVRFGPFELRIETGELRKFGTRIKLQAKPAQILEELVSRRGELVRREELFRRLWSTDTFVDFESGLNTAVNRLRAALGDNAETPRFIETIPRLGYRFIYPVEDSGSEVPGGDIPSSPDPSCAATGNEVNMMSAVVAKNMFWRLALAMTLALICQFLFLYADSGVAETILHQLFSK